MARPGGRSRRRKHAAVGSVGAMRFAPLIDVVFLLMMYFLLAAEFREPERVFRVDLPALEGATDPADPFALPERPISVLVRSAGGGSDTFDIETDSPLLPRVATGPDLLLALVEARDRELGIDQRFLLRAGHETRWEHALAALNIVLRAGYSNVRFSEPAP